MEMRHECTMESRTTTIYFKQYLLEMHEEKETRTNFHWTAIHIKGFRQIIRQIDKETNKKQKGRDVREGEKLSLIWEDDIKHVNACIKKYTNKVYRQRSQMWLDGGWKCSPFLRIKFTAKILVTIYHAIFFILFLLFLQIKIGRTYLTFPPPPSH